MSRRKLVPRLILIVVGIAIGSFLAFTAFSKRPQAQRRAVTTTPPTYSKVKNIEVVGTKVINEGTPAAGVSVEVRNNSDKPVVALDLVCGEGAVTKNGLTDEQNPLVVIPPYGNTTIEMSFSEMSVDAPLVVSAVTYADGMEEGDEKSLRAMHKLREHDRRAIKETRARQKEAKNP